MSASSFPKPGLGSAWNGSADHNVPCSLQGHETRAVGLWRVLYFVISFGCCREVESAQTGTEVDQVFFHRCALKSVLSFLFSDHLKPGAFSVLSFYHGKRHVRVFETWANCLLYLCPSEIPFSDFLFVVFLSQSLCPGKGS